MGSKGIGITGHQVVHCIPAGILEILNADEHERERPLEKKRGLAQVNIDFTEGISGAVADRQRHLHPFRNSVQQASGKSPSFPAD